MRWILLVLAVGSVYFSFTSVYCVGGEDGKLSQEEEWQEMPQEQEEIKEEWQELPQEEPDYHELHEMDNRETTRKFQNPWTLAPDYSGNRVFEDDDEELLRPEWEAQEFLTTKAPWTRRTFNWTRPSRNWTTQPRSTRRMLTGLTYNSSHVLCTQDPCQLIEPTGFVSYIVVDKHNRYHTFIKYREGQNAFYMQRIEEIKQQIKSLDTIQKCLSKDSFHSTSEDNLTNGIYVDLKEHKLNQEIKVYEMMMSNFKKQIVASKNLNQLDEKKDGIKRELAKKEELYAIQRAGIAKKIGNFTKHKNTTVDISNEYSDEYYRINDTFCELLHERASVVQSLHAFNKEYSKMLTTLDQIRRNFYDRGDYEYILFNIKHLSEKLELELSNDKIDIESYEKRKDILRHLEHIVQFKTSAAQYLDEVREAKFKSNYLERSIKTNIPIFDHYMYEKHLNRTLESMGRKLRELFQVKSLEYDDDDYAGKENGTDYNEIDRNENTKDNSTFVNPITTQHFLQKKEQFREREGNDSKQKMEGNVKQILHKKAMNEYNNHTCHDTDIHPITKADENSNGFNSSEEIGRKFKHQDYNEILGEKFIIELRDLEQHVDVLHAKVNKTYAKFSDICDRLGYSTYMAEITDKFNYQNLVKIFGIPANFSKYLTQDGKHLTEELVLQRIGSQLNKKLPLKKIKQVYQDWSTDYLRPPLVAEFNSYKEKKKWIKDYMNFILIKSRQPDTKPVFTRLKLKPRVLFMSWIEYRHYPLKYKYDRFIIRDDLPPRMNELILRVKRKINETGMSHSSFVWHNNSRVFFRRHYHGHIRPVFYFDNLDKLFDESDECSREATGDELPRYLQKRTTSSGKRWVMMKPKRKFFLRPKKKRTTKYMFWAVTRTKRTKLPVEVTRDKKALAKEHRVW